VRVAEHKQAIGIFFEQLVQEIPWVNPVKIFTSSSKMGHSKKLTDAS
jgi:hypothetical protein